MAQVKSYEKLSIRDNFLFQKVMRTKHLCKYLIEKILHIQIRDITYPEEEKAIDMTPASKSIRLDVYVEDDKGKVYDIEMQTTDSLEGALPKRTRYYQGMIDMNLIEKGQDYEDLNPCFIIFICTFDPFRRALPMYTFTNRCKEDGEELGDETTKLFLNSTAYGHTEDPDLAGLLRYIDQNIPTNPFTRELDKTIQHIKSQEETRREYMTFAMELRQQRREGVEEGRTEERKKNALRMLREGLSPEMTARCTELSLQEVRDLVHISLDDHSIS